MGVCLGGGSAWEGGVGGWVWVLSSRVCLLEVFVCVFFVCVGKEEGEGSSGERGSGRGGGRGSSWVFCECSVVFFGQ